MKKYIFIALILLSVSCKKDGNENNSGNNGGSQGTELKGDGTPKTPGAEIFYKGTTMCFTSYMQDCGLKYRENDVETDPYLSVKNHGGNCVRLQLDQLPFDKKGTRKIDWQTYDRVLADARKAKAQGLQIVLTLKPDYDKYTDDATHHNILPPKLIGKTDAQIGQALYDWVLSSLVKLGDEGIYPAIVAVGNEVNVGFMQPNETANLDNLRTGKLLVYGLKAVRDYAASYNPACLIAIHIANPSHAYGSIQAYEKAGATDYDIVAVSYYPGSAIGHSLPSSGIQGLCQSFPQKKVMVLETSYTFTTGSVNGTWKGDWCENAYNYPDWNDATNAVNYTPAKAREWLGNLANEIKTNGGIGVVTWGTESLPDTQENKGHGTGLYTYPATWAYGSTWENNSYWDFTNNNNLHEGIDWMMDVN